MVEGEPGPNLYWRGKPIDFLQLTFDLHILGRENDTERKINKLPYVNVNDGYIITAKSSMNGNILCEVKVKDIVIDLDHSLWQRIVNMFLRISFFPCHNYIEFDKIKLKEDANIIISSEAL